MYRMSEEKREVYQEILDECVKNSIIRNGILKEENLTHATAPTDENNREIELMIDRTIVGIYVCCAFMSLPWSHVDARLRDIANLVLDQELADKILKFTQIQNELIEFAKEDSDQYIYKLRTLENENEFGESELHMNYTSAVIAIEDVTRRVMLDKHNSMYCHILTMMRPYKYSSLADTNPELHNSVMTMKFNKEGCLTGITCIGKQMSETCDTINGLIDYFYHIHNTSFYRYICNPSDAKLYENKLCRVSDGMLQGFFYGRIVNVDNLAEGESIHDSVVEIEIPNSESEDKMDHVNCNLMMLDLLDESDDEYEYYNVVAVRRLFNSI